MSIERRVVPVCFGVLILGKVVVVAGRTPGTDTAFILDLAADIAIILLIAYVWLRQD